MNQLIEQGQQNFNLFETNRYKNQRNRKISLFIEIDNHSLSKGKDNEFNIKLNDPLLIDKHSEVYLDNFITFNSLLADSYQRSAFSIKINEFNIHQGAAISASTSKNSFNNIIIPNENRSVGNFFSTVSHKAKKYNYICDINPIKISSISGYITDLEGKPIFNGNDADHLYTYATINVTTWNVTGHLYALHTNQPVTITISGNPYNAIILSNSEKDSNIYFATDGVITGFTAGDIIKITYTDSNGDTHTAELRGSNHPYILDTSTDIDNPSHKARAILEFTIISKE
jgi:hypothetical protein